MDNRNSDSDQNEVVLKSQDKIIPTGGWELDLESLILTFDTKTVNLILHAGFKEVPDSISLLEFSERFIHPEDVTTIKERYEYALDNISNPDYFDRFEYRLLSPDKTEHVVLLNTIFNDAGKVQGTAQLISEFKTSPVGLLNQDKSFRSIIDNTTDYVFVTNREGNLMLWNKVYENAIEQYFGKKIQLGLYAPSVLPEEKRPEWLALLEVVLKGEKVITELSLQFDKKYYYEVSVNPIPGIAGEIIGAAYWVRDITDKKLLIDIDQLEARVLSNAIQQPILEDSLFILLSGIEEFFPTLKTYITLVDFENYILKWKCSPSISDEYLAKIPYVKIGPAEGSCGTAAFTRKAVFVNDIASSELWISYRDITLLHGYKACISYPIINTEGLVLGTIGAYLTTSRNLEPLEIELLERIVNIAGILIDRQSALDKAIKKQLQLQEISKSIPGILYEVIIDSSGERKFSYVSDKSMEILGFSPEEIMNDYKLIWKRIHPDDIENVKTSLANSIRLMKPWNCEVRIKPNVNSAYKWFRVNADHSLADDGTYSSYGVFLDINDLKETEESLRNKEEEVSAVISSIDDMIIEISQDGIFLNVWANDENKLLSEPKSFIGKNIESVMSLDVINKFNNAKQNISKPGETYEFEYSIEKKEVKTDYKAKVGLVNYRSQIGRRYFITIKDVTKLKLVEQKSKRLEEIIHEAGKIAKVGAFEFYLDTNEVIWSDEVYAIFEVSKEIKGEELRKIYFSRSHPHDAPLLNAAIERATLNVEAYELERRIVLPDGRIKWLLGRGYPLVDEDGKVKSIQGVCQDITERKLFELDNQKLSLVARETSNGVIITDALGKIEWVNDGFIRNTGFTLNEVMGRTPGSFLQGEKTNPEKISFMSNKIKNGEPFFIQIENYTKSGEEFLVEMEVKAIYNGQNELVNFIAIQTDITQRKNSEEIIRANLKEKELLLSEINHRVKNNLAIISSLLQLQQLHSKDDSTRMVLKESIGRLKSMSLVYEKLYQGGNFSKVDFNLYISDISEHIRKSFPNTGNNIVIISDVPTISIDIIAAVPFGLIINELLTNAFIHAFKGRNSGEINLTFKEEKNQYVLEVVDNGIGLPSSFDFGDVKSLGLTLVKTLTTQLQGVITFNSVLNQGTSIRLSFPGKTTAL